MILVFKCLNKSWVQGTNHRDSSIYLRSMPMPNFQEVFYWHKCSAQGEKHFKKSTPEPKLARARLIYLFSVCDEVGQDVGDIPGVV